MENLLEEENKGDGLVHTIKWGDKIGKCTFVTN
jgi:hypothetical protein